MASARSGRPSLERVKRYAGSRFQWRSHEKDEVTSHDSSVIRSDARRGNGRTRLRTSSISHGDLTAACERRARFQRQARKDGTGVLDQFSECDSYQLGTGPPREPIWKKPGLEPSSGRLRITQMLARGSPSPKRIIAVVWTRRDACGRCTAQASDFGFTFKRTAAAWIASRLSFVPLIRGRFSFDGRVGACHTAPGFNFEQGVAAGAAAGV